MEHPKKNPRHKTVYSPILLRQCTLLDCELQLIRTLSQAYCAEYSSATDASWPCPKEIVLEDITENEAIANANALQDAFLATFGKQDEDRSVEVVQNK